MEHELHDEQDARSHCMLLRHVMQIYENAGQTLRSSLQDGRVLLIYYKQAADALESKSSLENQSLLRLWKSICLCLHRRWRTEVMQRVLSCCSHKRMEHEPHVAMCSDARQYKPPVSWQVEASASVQASLSAHFRAQRHPSSSRRDTAIAW